MVKVSPWQCPRPRLVREHRQLGLAPSHWLGCSIEPATDFTFGHTGMVVQETDKRESEVSEVATETDSAMATGDAAEADGDSPRDGEWSEYTALHSFEGQQGEAAQQAHGSAALWQCLSLRSARARREGTPGGFGQLGTPRATAGHRAPSHRLGHPRCRALGSLAALALPCALTLTLALALALTLPCTLTLSLTLSSSARASRRSARPRLLRSRCGAGSGCW